MEDFMKADIFFFITSLAVILITIGALVALFYLIEILRSVRDVSKRVDEGSKLFAEDLSAFRESVKARGFALGQLFSFLQKRSRWFSRKSKTRRTEEEKGTTEN